MCWLQVHISFNSTYSKGGTQCSLLLGGHVSPTNPAFNIQELEKLLIMSKAKYLVAHSFNLDTALEAAKLVGIPVANVWCIDNDPKKRAKHWKEMVVNSTEEADPVKYTAAECRNTLAYLCFSSGTTGKCTIDLSLSLHKTATNYLADITQALQKASRSGKNALPCIN